MLPLYNAVKGYIKTDRSRFHMPGHKGNAALDLLSGAAPFDLTEIPETDSLFEAQGAILQSERMAAQIYGAKRTVYSAGGCTLCIQGMISLCCKPGDKIIMGRTVHHSAVNSSALLDLKPVWVMPRQSDPSLPGRIHPVDIKKAIEQNPDAAAVYITSPDYYGVISDIEGIKKVCGDIPLIVDNAHGAHLKFINGNLHPIAFADMTADSAHKSLNVLTGGAMLHINNEKYAAKAKDMMKLFGSTSPSYLIMLSLESGIAAAPQLDFDSLIKKVQQIKTAAAQKGFELPTGVVDPIRITLGCYGAGVRGDELAQLLRESSIEPELATDSHVVFIPTPYNKAEDLKRLLNFINNFEPRAKIRHERFSAKLPEQILSIRQAVFSDCELIPTERAIGRIAGESTVPCPPCIPIVMPGEIIDDMTAKQMIKYGVNRVLAVTNR